MPKVAVAGSPCAAVYAAVGAVIDKVEDVTSNLLDYTAESPLKTTLSCI